MKTFLFSLLFFLLIACEKHEYYVFEKTVITSEKIYWGESYMNLPNDTVKSEIKFKEHYPELINSDIWYDSIVYRIQINYKYLYTYADKY